VEAFSPEGHSCQVGEAGELVCVRPFPCMPVGFWPLPGFGADESVKVAAERFRLAYFAEYKDVWCTRPIVRPVPLTDFVWIKRSRGPRANHSLSAWKWRWTHNAGKKRRRPVSTLLPLPITF
jgi:hypothetical protein